MSTDQNKPHKELTDVWTDYSYEDFTKDSEPRVFNIPPRCCKHGQLCATNDR